MSYVPLNFKQLKKSAAGNIDSGGYRQCREIDKTSAISCDFLSYVTLKLKELKNQRPVISTVDVATGFLEKEIRKDGIPMLDTGENPDAPAPREMIDLEVS